MQYPRLRPWQAAYVYAVLESDATKILGRICAAWNAIEARLDEPNGVDDSELEALADARLALEDLRTNSAVNPAGPSSRSCIEDRAEHQVKPQTSADKQSSIQ